MRSLDSITKTHKKMVEKQNISLKQYYRMTYPIWSAEKDEENDMNTCPCTLLIGPDTNWNNGQCKKSGSWGRDGRGAMDGGQRFPCGKDYFRNIG